MKPLTTNSWILTSDGERIGLVSALNNKLSIIGNLPQKEYQDVTELKKILGNLSIETAVKLKVDIVANQINGYPVKHLAFFSAVEEPIPNYTRSETSQLRYAAGYYALKFTYAWTPSFCPKLDTLFEYEYLGPFKSKLELQHQISTKNKEITV